MGNMPMIMGKGFLVWVNSQLGSPVSNAIGSLALEKCPLPWAMPIGMGKVPAVTLKVSKGMASLKIYISLLLETKSNDM
jgi:hypothetical protein